METIVAILLVILAIVIIVIATAIFTVKYIATKGYRFVTRRKPRARTR